MLGYYMELARKTEESERKMLKMEMFGDHKKTSVHHGSEWLRLGGGQDYLTSKSQVTEHQKYQKYHQHRY